jgi:hypothetical protein
MGQQPRIRSRDDDGAAVPHQGHGDAKRVDRALNVDVEYPVDGVGIGIDQRPLRRADAHIRVHGIERAGRACDAGQGVDRIHVGDIGRDGEHIRRAQGEQVRAHRLQSRRVDIGEGEPPAGAREGAGRRGADARGRSGYQDERSVCHGPAFLEQSTRQVPAGPGLPGQLLRQPV